QQVVAALGGVVRRDPRADDGQQYEEAEDHEPGGGLRVGHEAEPSPAGQRDIGFDRGGLRVDGGQIGAGNRHRQPSLRVRGSSTRYITSARKLASSTESVMIRKMPCNSG